MSATDGYGGQGRAPREADGGGRDAGARKLAEWVTLGISGVIVVGVAAFLAYQATLENAPHVPAEVSILTGELRRERGQFILPVEVRNLGQRTMQGFRGELTYRSPEGALERRDIEIDYLGERASQRVYFHFDQDPTQLRELQAKPLSYRVE